VATAATPSSSDERSRVIALGIESTAHTFGVAVVSDKHPYILSDARGHYRPSKGGILPREVAQYFSQVAGSVVREALSKAGVSMDDVDLIAVALGPGMGPALRIGATVARALSSKYSKPLYSVNHGVAHIEIARFLTGLRDPLVIYVSGGTTTIASYLEGRYRVFGETLDIALGNLQDTFAREIGIAPPYIVGGRHVIDICAEGGKFIEELPYVVKGQDVSYSGLLTAAVRLVKKGWRKADVCYTFREIAYSSVVEVAERGLAHTGKKEVVLTGGVAASKLLNEKVEAMAKSHNARFKPIPPKYAGDNGVMIALTGILAFKSGVPPIPPEEAIIKQRWRLDRVDIPWYPMILGD